MKISSFRLLLFAGTIASLPHLGIASCESLFSSKYQLPIVNQDQIKFYGWNDPGVKQVELKIDNDTTLKEFLGMKKTIYLDVYFHDIGGNGLEKWIQDNKGNFFNRNPEYAIISISVDYQKFVLDKPQAIKTIEPIANYTAELLIRIEDLLSGRKVFFNPIGHGFGAIIAASVIERVTRYNISYKPHVFAALDPEIIDPQDPDVLEVLKNFKQIKIPQINRSLSRLTYVLHTSTCSRTPVIPACNSNTSDTMGHGDFYPNGGGTQPGCLQNDSSCSRRRAQEIFVESVAVYIHDRTKFYVTMCSNFAQFQNYTCNTCSSSRVCYEMGFYFTSEMNGRFYFYTNSVPPYAKGFDLSPP